jgi:hypothetical protein
MANVLVFTETNNGKVKNVTLEILGRLDWSKLLKLL